MSDCGKFNIIVVFMNEIAEMAMSASFVKLVERCDQRWWYRQARLR
jgi:hypothetical protein